MEKNVQRKFLNNRRRLLIFILFAVPAVLCIVYFIAIVVYSGISTSFCLIWVFFAAVFLVMGYYAQNAGAEGGGMPQALPTFIFTSFAFGCFVMGLLLMLVVRHAGRSDDSESADYTIVLGARVYRTGISKTLKYRLDRALEYYQEHPETVLVLTGGKEANDAIPEALAMYNYLIANGVPGMSMIIEAEALSTAENIENSIRLIADDTLERKTPEGPGDEVWDEDYIPSIAIVTSDFHMMRAVRIAGGIGVDTVIELPAHSDNLLFIHQSVRECAAIIKDFFVGNIKVNEEELPFNKI